MSPGSALGRCPLAEGAGSERAPGSEEALGGGSPTTSRGLAPRGRETESLKLSLYLDRLHFGGSATEDRWLRAY